MLLELLTITEIISPKYEQPKPEPVKTVQVEKKSEPKVEKPVEPPEPVIEQYVVVPGDSLSKIAKAKNTTVERLWSFNLELNNQNLIYPNQVIKIPPADVEVAPRALVEQVVQSAAPTANTAPRASSAGNTYSAGYCTWYVKNRRPDLPNRMGNANRWLSSAQSQGLSTGSTPRAGAVGTTTAGPYGHVVYIESVNGDGTVNVSEMNYRGWNVVSSRTAPASAFSYIY